MNEFPESPKPRGARGARSNPTNRFESLRLEPIEWDDWDPEDEPGGETDPILSGCERLLEHYPARFEKVMGTRSIDSWRPVE